ncbi:MAG TPA: patatin-like phospholipase family protein [Rhizomicrobium sp.]|jgi:NTE family protein
MSQTVKRPPFECVALTLQGGGALGAYQGGVYQGLAEAGLHPDWVAGISIGAINAAIIAGNERAKRVEKLREFWESITATTPWNPLNLLAPAAMAGDAGRHFFNQLSAAEVLTTGVQGFFAPRLPPPQFAPEGSAGATSYYDTQPLVATLERFVEFDRINNGSTRLSAGSVNVRTGNFVYFDTTERKIGPEHILASAALPPGFPAIEIEGEHYWDGGLLSNTPLQWVLQYGPRRDTLAFQVDLWNARGRFPRTIMEVATRQKEILYSSRTRENVRSFVQNQQLRHAFAKLLETLPAKVRHAAAAGPLREFSDHKVYSIVHLIYRTKHYEGESKDYEFSQLSMRDHWQAGYNDVIRTLRHPETLARPKNADGVTTHDFLDTD